MKKVAVVVGVVFFLAYRVSADVSVAILKGEAIGEQTAALAVSAVDDAGRPIKGLSEKNFELTVGGEKKNNFTVEPASTVEEPLTIILAVDVSGSMWGTPFKETQKAISIFLDQLEKRDFVSLISFGTEVRFGTDFTKERYTVRDQVEALRPVDDWTHLYDATYEAIRKGKDSPTTRTAVVLLTDGRDERSNRTREEAVGIATGASIPVFTLGFGQNVDRAFLEEIAQGSGGDFIYTPEPEKIPELYQKVLDQLRNQYLIQFDFTKEPSAYKASVILIHGGERARSTKEFLFNPAGTSILVSPQGPQPSDQLQKPWHVSLTQKELIILGTIVLAISVMLIVILTIVYIRVRNRRITREKEERESWMQRIMEMVESNKSEECELEYPTGCPTAVHYLDTRTGQMTKLSKTSPDVILQIDSLRGAVPLVHEGVEVLEELIIAKMTKERSTYRKPGSVYLWTKNEFVSRANKERPGHARIFISKGERFAIEDLGSMNGTWIGGKKIDGAFPLQDGDVLDVGGKNGIRVVFKEGRSEIDALERTMVFK